MDTVMKEVKEVDEKLDDGLQRYAKMLCAAQVESDQHRNFRLRWPKRFVQLCKFHLSVLVELPTNFFNEQQLAYHYMEGSEMKRQASVASLRCAGVAQNQFKRQTMKSWRLITSRALGGAFGVTQSYVQPWKGNDVATWQNIKALIDLIDTEDCLSTEGIFRKSGNALRVREIRQRLNEEQPFQTSVRPCVHDLASTLKGTLTDMEEPVLTKLLVPLFRQVADLTLGQLDEKGQRVARRPSEQHIAAGKQLMSLRLLCLLMPEKHRDLLQWVLHLLRNVIKYSDKNRLTADTLGILFGPVLLSPKQAPATEMQLQQGQLAGLMTIMINEGIESLWQIPLSFANDIDRIVLDLERGRRRTDSQDLDLDDLETTMLVEANGVAETEQEVVSTDSGIEGTDGSQNGEVEAVNLAAQSRLTQTSTAKFTPTSRKVKVIVAESDGDDDDLIKEDGPLVTCLRFAEGAVDGDDEPTSLSQSETKMALHKLCQSIQALPDSDPKKARLIKRMNKTNSGLPQVVEKKPRTPRRPKTPRKSAGSSKSHSNNINNNNNTNNMTRSTTHLRLSPANHVGFFQRANVTPSNSAVRAARNIRSSIRRRLAVCTNQNDSGCQKIEVTPKTKDTRRCNRRPANVHSVKARGEEKLTSSFDNREMFFDPRASIVSRTGNEWLLCCPISLHSPFKRGRGHAHTAGTLEPVVKMAMTRRKSVEYKFPVYLPQESLVTQSNPALDKESDDTRPKTYFPTVMTDIYPIRELLQRTECEQASKPRSLASFGYRTVGSASKRLSGGLNLLTMSCSGGMRRVHTMPNLRATPDGWPDLDDFTKSLLD